MWRWMIDDRTYGVGPLWILCKPLPQPIMPFHLSYLQASHSNLSSHFFCLLVTMILNLAFAWVPYALLVEVGILCITFPMMLLQAVFVYLRFARPDMDRPFKVCG